MPIYEYECKNPACHHYFTQRLPISELAAPTHEPCPVCGESRVQKILTGAPSIGDTVRLGMRRPDDGFKEVLQKIHEKTPGSTLKDASRFI